MVEWEREMDLIVMAGQGINYTLPMTCHIYMLAAILVAYYIGGVYYSTRLSPQGRVRHGCRALSGLHGARVKIRKTSGGVLSPYG